MLPLVNVSLPDSMFCLMAKLETNKLARVRLISILNTREGRWENTYQVLLCSKLLFSGS